MSGAATLALLVSDGYDPSARALTKDEVLDRLRERRAQQKTR